jgi:hypothetical protein
MGQHLFRHGLRRATFPRGEGFTALNNNLSDRSIKEGAVAPSLMLLQYFIILLGDFRS